MDMNKAVDKIDSDNAQLELNHIETNQGPKFAMSDADINKWMDA